MNRTELEAYIAETYPADSDSPWMTHPNYRVFRHRRNRKWFALVMDIPERYVGRPGRATLDVVNVKCDPIMIGSLRPEPGFFPAYHINKEKWITVSLDGRVPDGQIKWLLDLSFALTAPRMKKHRT